MVLYKFCPKCYSLNVGIDKNSGNYKCNQCGYIGPINQDSIDRINALKKAKDGQKQAAAMTVTNPINTETKEKQINKKTDEKPTETAKERLKNKGGAEWDLL